MPKYPTPFLGGSEPPERDRDRGAHKEWAKPFAPGAEPTQASSSADALSSDSSGDAAPADEQAFPDFLFGPDSAAPGGIAQGRSAAGATEGAGGAGGAEGVGLPAGSVERPAEKIRELLEGPMEDRVRSLIAKLRHHPVEEAISQAFAAGYAAAKGEGEEGS